MTVLRELVARLGFQVDRQGFDRADKSIVRLRDGLRSVATFVKAVGVGAVLKQVVTLASDANETANVLQQVFGDEGAAQVQQWAQTTGAAIGRSRFEIAEFAATMGAMLDPMVQNTAQAQEMSTTIAQLAVDLASFFNTTDKDALIALRAGLAGESEPLRRYGVVLLDATLQEFALAQGIHKRVQAMNVAEKTELRYQFILQKTTDAQGDAARTLNGYANASKALRAVVKDLATEMGLSALPMISRMMVGARGALNSFRELAQGTFFLQSAMEVLVAAAAVVAAALLAPFAGPALAIAALVLLVDELHSLFSGGTSVIGHYLDKFGGLGTADELVQNVTAGVKIMSEAWDQATKALSEFVAFIPDLQAAADILTNVGKDFGINLADMHESIRDSFNKFVDRGLVTAGATPFGDLPTYDPQKQDLGSTDRARGRGIRAGLMTSAQRDRATQAELDRQVASGAERRKEERRMRESAPGFGRARVSVPVPRGGGPASVDNSRTVNVDARGSTDPQRTTRMVEQAVRRVLSQDRQQRKAALTGAGR